VSTLTKQNYESDLQNVGIVGVGRLGSTLLATFRTHNIRPLYTDPRPHPELGRGIDLKELVSRSSLIFLTVQDDLILTTMSQIAEDESTVHEEKIFVICSGSFDLRNLDLSKREQWRKVKLHPLQSFTARNLTVFPEGTPFAVEAPETLEELFSNLVKSWKGIPHFLRGESWFIYHLAAVVAANFLPLLIRDGIDILSELTVDHSASTEWLRPLVEFSVQQALNADLAKPFSGPAARGDKKVMDRHLQWLSTHKPDLKNLYETLSHRIRERMEE
jgi:predicted short-subunit dehydrogenase-like oxidoreductase (DUF2520 family)